MSDQLRSCPQEERRDCAQRVQTFGERIAGLERSQEHHDKALEHHDKALETLTGQLQVTNALLAELVRRPEFSAALDIVHNKFVDYVPKSRHQLVEAAVFLWNGVAAIGVLVLLLKSMGVDIKP